MRNRFTHRRLAAVPLAAALALALTAGPAAAEQIEVGKKVRGPGHACKGNHASNDHVTVCFASKGEWLYVKDGEADGRSAYGQIIGRDRHCRNPYGAGTWVRCNYSFREGSVVTFRGYTRDSGAWPNPMRNETLYTSKLA